MKSVPAANPACKGHQVSIAGSPEPATL